ncbi:hypothetical protein CLF_103137 [Clonorchis sinensis]|uniref:Uncharacterized protein n=1 Tax=Clonorchis sinensis TaxID=79923 RepID=G7YND3_CLOSI|nr:hypothetical protein CLF_103137 [Clonorchis sinensis]
MAAVVEKLAAVQFSLVTAFEKGLNECMDPQTDQKNTHDRTLDSSYHCEFSRPTQKSRCLQNCTSQSSHHKHDVRYGAVQKPIRMTAMKHRAPSMDPRISLIQVVVSCKDSLANPNYNDNPKRLTQDVYVRGCPQTQVRRRDDGFMSTISSPVTAKQRTRYHYSSQVLNAQWILRHRVKLSGLAEDVFRTSHTAGENQGNTYFHAYKVRQSQSDELDFSRIQTRMSVVLCRLMFAFEAVAQEQQVGFPFGLGNLAVSQPSCFLLVACQLSTERVLPLNDFLMTQTHLITKLDKQINSHLIGNQRRYPSYHCSMTSTTFTPVDLPNARNLAEDSLQRFPVVFTLLHCRICRYFKPEDTNFIHRRFHLQRNRHR